MVDEEQVAKARAWLYEALDEVLADNPGLEEYDDGEVVADLITSMAVTGEFPVGAVRELARRELGWIPQAAQPYLREGARR